MPAGDNLQKRVLLVDDSKFVRTTFKAILEPSVGVAEASDGEAAWQAIQSDPSIAMVFTDLDMPKLGGYALIARIRGSQDARIRELPVVVISGSQEAASTERARKAGANDFIAKTADAPEILARLENLLRLAGTVKELAATRQALEQSATHDPLTGAFTAHYLLTEGRKHFSYVRRHGGELSVVALRVDSHADTVRRYGKSVADQLLARIAKTIVSVTRAEDSVARTGEELFMVLAAGAGTPQMTAVAQRLCAQLAGAKVSHGKELLKISARYGVASLDADAATSVEDLLKLAVQRLRAPGPAAAPPVPPQAPPVSRAKLPPDLEQAIAVLEKADLERPGPLNDEIIRRLLPLLQKAKRKP